MQSQLQLIWNNLQALGPGRVAGLAVAAILIFASVGLGARYINRPAFETLYVGLERDDINRIGIVLSEAGIKYDADSSGKSVLVETGRASDARMILAEKGLPGSVGSGYELFDKLGSLGLTSFMQEVTRVRVLEGEIARSIQSISGIKAARVHIVQPDRSSFTSRNREATASVLVKTNGAQPAKSAFAIRHLVAAAVPGLSSEKVTVLDASGQLLAAGEDPATTMLNSSISIQRMVEDNLKANIASALAPHLGTLNFRVNVQAEVDTDKRQTEETIFDPESRVERSVQVVKTQDSTSQQSAAEPATVEQNLPNATPESATGPQSSQASERREETTNYEVSSKKIAVVSNGYVVKKISASIVLNNGKLREIAGEGASDAALTAQLEKIRNVARATIGFNEDRGDVIDVTAVEFTDQLPRTTIPENGFFRQITAHVGTVINALAFLAAVVVVLLAGVRPMIKAITSKPETTAETALLPTMPEPALEAPDNPDRLASPAANPSSEFQAELEQDTEEMMSNMRKSPKERLVLLAEENEEGSAQVLRRWIGKELAA
ncbi:MAG: flagellar basal-body MS-ring/collar protein FliF [Rhizobiaceae bacterium]